MMTQPELFSHFRKPLIWQTITFTNRKSWIIFYSASLTTFSWYNTQNGMDICYYYLTDIHILPSCVKIHNVDLCFHCEQSMTRTHCQSECLCGWWDKPSHSLTLAQEEKTVHSQCVHIRQHVQLKLPLNLINCNYKTIKM